MNLNYTKCTSLAEKAYDAIKGANIEVTLLLFKEGTIVSGATSSVLDSEGWVGVAESIEDETEGTYDTIFGEYGESGGGSTHTETVINCVASVSPNKDEMKRYGIDKEADIAITVPEIELINKGLYTEGGEVSISSETDYVKTADGSVFKLDMVAPLNVKLLRPVIFILTGYKDRTPNPVVDDGT